LDNVIVAAKLAVGAAEKRWLPARWRDDPLWHAFGVEQQPADPIIGGDPTF
jgi:hypothetical protein